MLWIPSAIRLLSATNTCRSLIWWHNKSRLQSRAARDCTPARKASSDGCSQRRVCSPAFCQCAQRQPSDMQTKLPIFGQARVSRIAGTSEGLRWLLRVFEVVHETWAALQWLIQTSICSLDTQWSTVSFSVCGRETLLAELKVLIRGTLVSWSHKWC